ncbi:Dyp-type peroxidase [Microbacterium trichothecenolyticum]|uniref:Deferrochelatase/peroxidase EfeB n=1 Tax=Microbacterium trichothecenolyticum TaxID=69370 RepID=A0ABU0TSU0_MICTR|nr:Dyp-type peroxidase [Microbacterium trichothecenolyticum]MDQ1122738.1 deferrochelatase/peroxidase EfeB [Microbacterium trichothecenolyticum]
MSEQPDETPSAKGLSRRALLLTAAAGGFAVGGLAGGGIAASAAAAGHADGATGDVVDLSTAHPFYGTGAQAGITTPVQRYSVFMTFDYTGVGAADLQVLLARWSAAIAQLMQGKTVGEVEPERVDAIGKDTGEALDLEPAALTVTVGLGPGLFTDRTGLADRKPPLLRDLQLGDTTIKPELNGGDLSVQACADDPQVAYHAVRALARMGKDSGSAATRWTVMGFGRAAAGKGQSTPRNLMGYKDGTRNIFEADDLDAFVWTSDGPEWTRGGTYQVVRKIQMHIENWDTDRVSDQNNVFGRHKVTGAPLTGTQEFDEPDFAQQDASGSPVIPATAHIRLAAHETNGGVKILRRGFNYTDGINQFGFLDGGLLFLSYQNDPAHFEQLQSRLSRSDALNEYITHIGSGIFFVPPAPREGSYIAAGLFA